MKQGRKQAKMPIFFIWREVARLIFVDFVLERERKGVKPMPPKG